LCQEYSKTSIDPSGQRFGRGGDDQAACDWHVVDRPEPDLDPFGGHGPGRGPRTASGERCRVCRLKPRAEEPTTPRQRPEARPNTMAWRWRRTLVTSSIGIYIADWAIL